VKETDPNGAIRDVWIDAGSMLGEGVGLLFTNRLGGTSQPPYDSLNLSYHTRDNTHNVRANRNIVALKTGVAEGNFVYLDQVHGTVVKRARLEVEGDPHAPFGERLKATDGVFTTEPELALSVLTADCLPVALSCSEKDMVAMLHAGWRGTLNDLVGRAIGRFKSELGVDPCRMKAVIGPGIGPCCYVVEEGRARVFVEKYGRKNGVILKESGYRLDLRRANVINLLEAGMREENIISVGGCTCCERRYFSFRRDGVTGRQGAFIYRNA
jgi:YfiH family protein